MGVVSFKTSQCIVVTLCVCFLMMLIDSGTENSQPPSSFVRQTNVLILF